MPCSTSRTLAAVIHIVRNRSKGWVLWLIASLFGVGQFRFDWTSGKFDFQLLTVQLLGVGMTRADSVFATWVLSLPFPLPGDDGPGATFVKYKQALKRRAAEAADAPPSEPPVT